MQAIEPAVWAQGKCESKNHQSILAVESNFKNILESVSYTHLRAHET